MNHNVKMSKMDRDSIINTIKQNKEKLFKLGINRIGLFGSYVRNQANEDSDIDILIDFDSNSKISLFELIEIEEMLESLFERKIDLALMRKLKPHISKHILNEVIYVQ